MAIQIYDVLRDVCPSSDDDERSQLEANLLADGCRDPLAVWEPEGPGGPQVLLDGHTRYGFIQQHGLAFQTTVIPLGSLEEAINWIIDNQLGRRNLTPERKSYLRGKRYNLEKGTRGGDQKSNPHNDGLTAERLADEYQVSPATIERDGEFAEAVDILETKVRKDIRDAALKRQRRKEAPRTTKKQATKAGQAIKEGRVEPLPFMRRAAWKDYQVIEAIALLADAEISPDEQAQVNVLLDRPHIPASEGLAIVRNLAKMDLAQRQRIYALHGSADPREQSLALTLAAKKAPEPDPQVLIARRLDEAGGDVRRRE